MTDKRLPPANPVWRAVLPLIVVGLALALRLWAIGWGGPYEYHPDEHYILNPALHMAVTGDLDPHWFHYPSLLMDVEATAAAVVHRLAGWPIELNTLPPHADGMDVLPALFPYVVLGRALVAVCCSLACLAVYFALRTAGCGRFAALAGGLALAVAPLAVTNSHFLTTDVPSLAGGAMTIWASTHLLRRGGSWAVLAGVGAGLAAGAKYNAGLVVIIPLLILAVAGQRERRVLDAGLVVLAAAITFALSSPFVFLDAHTALRDVQAELQHYRTGHLGAEGSANWRWYTRTLLTTAWGPVLSGAAFVGFLAGVRRNWRLVLPVLVFVVIYVALIGAPVVRFDRNLLPVFPALAMAAGLAAQLLWDLLTGTLHRPLRETAVALVVLVVVLLPVVRADSAADAVLTRQDARTQGLEALQTTLPANACVVREAYTPQLEWTRSCTLSVWSLGDHPVPWYTANGYRYAIASATMYDRYLAGRKQYASNMAVYNDIFAHRLLLSVPARAGTPGPSLRVYDLGGP